MQQCPGRSSTCWCARSGYLAAIRQFFTHALAHGPYPTEVSTDLAPAYARVGQRADSAAALNAGWSAQGAPWNRTFAEATTPPPSTVVDSRHRLPVIFTELTLAI